MAKAGAAAAAAERAGASPRVSIVSSFLNMEKYLAETIDSVLAQDYGDFECATWSTPATPIAARLSRVIWR